MLNLNLNLTSVTRFGAGGVPPGPSFDPDAQAFFDATGLTDTTEQTLVNNMVVELKDYGLWTNMKALYPFVGNTADMQKYNLKDPRDLDAAYRLTFYGGWTHAPRAATPNGVNGYADLHLDPLDLTNPQQIFYGFYWNTYNSAGGDVFGSLTSGQNPAYRVALWGSEGATNTYWQTGNAATFLSSFGYGVGTGLFSFAMNSGAFKLGINNYGFATGTDTFTTTAGPINDFYVGTFNLNGGTQGFSNAPHCALLVYDGALDNVQAAKLQAVLDNYKGGRQYLNSMYSSANYYAFNTGAFLTNQGGIGGSLTNNGSVAEVTGKFGQAAEFNGSNYFTTGSTAIEQEPYSGANAWTLSAWFSNDQYATTAQSIYSKWTGSAGTRVQVRPGFDILVTMGTQNMSFVTPSGAFGDDSWNHVCVVMRGGNQVTVYLNGVSLGTITRGSYTNANSTQVHIGRSAEIDFDYVVGRLDDYLLLSNRALDEGEINNIVYSSYPIIYNP